MKKEELVFATLGVAIQPSQKEGLATIVYDHTNKEKRLIFNLSGSSTSIQVLALKLSLENHLMKYLGMEEIPILKIVTHCHYLSDCFNKFLDNWSKNGWKKKNGRSILNPEQWKVIYESREFLQVQIPTDGQEVISTLELSKQGLSQNGNNSTLLTEMSCKIYFQNGKYEHNSIQEVLQKDRVYLLKLYEHGNRIDFKMKDWILINVIWADNHLKMTA